MEAPQQHADPYQYYMQHMRPSHKFRILLRIFTCLFNVSFKDFEISNANEHTLRHILEYLAPGLIHLDDNSTIFEIIANMFNVLLPHVKMTPHKICDILLPPMRGSRWKLNVDNMLVHGVYPWAYDIPLCSEQAQSVTMDEATIVIPSRYTNNSAQKREIVIPGVELEMVDAPPPSPPHSEFLPPLPGPGSGGVANPMDFSMVSSDDTRNDERLWQDLVQSTSLVLSRGLIPKDKGMKRFLVQRFSRVLEHLQAD
jgi:hypothetical protein